MDVVHVEEGTFANIKRAWIPRIIVGARKGIATVKIIVVGKNPGHHIPEGACNDDFVSVSDKDNAELLFHAIVCRGKHYHLESVLGRQGRYHRKLTWFLRDALRVVTTVGDTEATVSR